MDINQLREAAGWMAKTDLVPQAYRNKPDNCVVCWCYGAERGLTPLNALNSIAVVNGTPTVYGTAVTALVTSHPNFAGMTEANNFDEIDDAKDAVATCTMHRRMAGGKVESFTKSFSYADAIRAGLTGKDNWKGYPKMMLENRARNWCARVAFADALRGMAVKEEIEDLATMAKAEVVDVKDEKPEKGTKGLAKALQGKGAK